MSTIFQMSRNELVSLLIFLRPALAKNTPNFENFESTRLRMFITEWLLLNGLSTMHKFERENNIQETECSTSAIDEKLWKMPNKIDCSSCGKYRVGKCM